MKPLLDLIINYKKTKKIYFLTIGNVSSKGYIATEQLNEIINKIKHNKLKRKEFGALIQECKLES